MDMEDWDWDSSGFMAAGYDSGGVRFEFVDSPRVSGDYIEWTFRTAGGQTAQSGTVTSHIAVMGSDRNNIIGTGSNKLGSELRPGDTGGARFNPVQYTPNDGEYYASITVSGDARDVSYRIADRRLQ